MQSVWHRDIVMDNGYIEGLEAPGKSKELVELETIRISMNALYIYIGIHHPQGQIGKERAHESWKGRGGSFEGLKFQGPPSLGCTGQQGLCIHNYVPTRGVSGMCNMLNLVKRAWPSAFIATETR